MKPWYMGAHLKVLSKSFPTNTNMTRFKCFSKYLHHCALDEISLSIGWVNRIPMDGNL